MPLHLKNQLEKLSDLRRDFVSSREKYFQTLNHLLKDQELEDLVKLSLIPEYSIYTEDYIAVCSPELRKAYETLRSSK